MESRKDTMNPVDTVNMLYMENMEHGRYMSIYFLASSLRRSRLRRQLCYRIALTVPAFSRTSVHGQPCSTTKTQRVGRGSRERLMTMSRSR